MCGLPAASRALVPMHARCVCSRSVRQATSSAAPVLQLQDAVATLKPTWADAPGLRMLQSFPGECITGWWSAQPVHMQLGLACCAQAPAGARAPLCCRCCRSALSRLLTQRQTADCLQQQNRQQVRGPAGQRVCARGARPRRAHTGSQAHVRGGEPASRGEVQWGCGQLRDLSGPG